MEDDDAQKELQLLPLSKTSQYLPLSGASKNLDAATDISEHGTLDLSLSINVGQMQTFHREANVAARGVQVLKQQTAEQIRLTSLEKAYAERVREQAKKEMELAEKEFARARIIWERARKEVDKAEKMKEMATRRIGPTCLEITCQTCRQCFQL